MRSKREAVTSSAYFGNEVSSVAAEPHMPAVEMLRKENFPRIDPAVARTTCSADISGADALMGHTRTHPEHEG